MRIISPPKQIPKDFTFRKGTKKDSSQIALLVHTVLREYGLTPEPHGVDHDLWNVEESYKDGYFGVILRDQKIVATYGLYPLSAEKVEVRKMYAYPNVRGYGLGQWMLLHLLAIAKHNDFKEVELETASALEEAIGLYKKFGFREKDFENKTPRCDKAFYLNI